MALLVSTTSGNWSTAGNWTVANTGVVSGAAPTNADEVAIPSANTVTASGYTANAAASGASSFVVAAGTGTIPNGAIINVSGTTGMYMVRSGGITAAGQTLNITPSLRALITAGSAIRVYGGTAGSVMTVDNTSATGGGDVVSGALLGGKLSWSRVADSTLTLRSNLTISQTDAELDMGKAGDAIPAARVAQIKWASGTPANGKYGFTCGGGNITTSKVFIFGAAKTGATMTTTAITAAASNPTVRVADATGWAVGDFLMFSSTTANTPASVDSFTIASLTLISGTIYDVGMTGTSANAHAIGCPVVNSSRNVRPNEPMSAGNSGYFNVLISSDALGTANTIEIRNAEFAFGTTSGAANTLSGLCFTGAVATSNTIITGVSGCSFTTLRNAQTVGAGFGAAFVYMTLLQITDCVFSTNSATLNSCLIRQAPLVNFSDCVSIGGGSWASIASSQGCQGWVENNCKHYSHRLIAYDATVSVGRIINDTIFDNCSSIDPGRSGSATVFNRCSFGMVYGATAGSALVAKNSDEAFAPAEANDCLFGAVYLATGDVTANNRMQDADYCRVTNRQANITQHTLTTVQGITNRENSIDFRSPSSISLRPLTANVAITNSISMVAVSGVAMRVIGYLRYDSNLTGATLPSITLSGAGSTPATFTQVGAANAWEKFDLTVTPSANGTVTLVTTVISTSATATAYLSGVVSGPWVTSSRHYGFIPSTVATQIVDNQIVQTTEATVAAYSTLETVDKIYDALSLWACDNPTEAIFFAKTAAGLTLTKNVIISDAAGTALTVAGANVTFKATSISGTKIETTGTITFGGTSVTGTAALIGSNGVSGLLQITGLTAAAVYVKDNSNAQVAYSASVTGTYERVIPFGSTGTWSAVTKPKGYRHAYSNFTASTGGTFLFTPSMPQKLNPDGSAMYTATPSALCAVSFTGTAQANIDLGDGTVSLQAAFDETEDALVTNNGMIWLASGKSDTSQFNSAGGDYLFLSTGWRLRRATAGDANATLNAFAVSADGTVVDDVNGGVQFLTSDSPTAIAAAVKVALDASLQIINTGVQKASKLTPHSTNL